jgi:integrase
MALYRRKESRIWWMDYTDAEGKRVRETTGTDNKQLAQELYDKTKAWVWQQKRLGVKKPRLFDEAVEQFLADKKGLRSISDYEDRANWWLEQFKGKPLTAITQELIVKTIKKKEGEVSPATCNRYLATLKCMLRMVCIKYKWISRDALPEFFFYEEPKGRTRWLEPDEIARLIDALPEHWRDIAIFSFATGMRQGNVRLLRWDQVNLTRKTMVVDGTEMKNGKDHGIPLNDAAVEALRRNIGNHHTYVFTYNGKPIRHASTATWKRALEKAGIEDFRRHDMRHTWATMLAQQGVPDSVLQKLGAWETPKMVDRYRHHSAKSLAPYAAQIDGVLKPMSQFASQGSDARREPQIRAVQ